MVKGRELLIGGRFNKVRPARKRVAFGLPNRFPFNKQEEIIISLYRKNNIYYIKAFIRGTLNSDNIRTS